MDIKKIKKRDFLKGFGMVSAGVVVAAADAAAQGRGGAAPRPPGSGGYPPGVPHATGQSMLDSPNYIGTASKGYGFRANWKRTLPWVPSVDPNYTPRRINNTRIYTRRDRTRLALILRSKAIGAPLSEIKTFLELYGAHGEGREAACGTHAPLLERQGQLGELLGAVRLDDATGQQHPRLGHLVTDGGCGACLLHGSPQGWAWWLRWASTPDERSQAPEGTRG